jgi:hypothetical protein
MSKEPKANCFRNYKDCLVWCEEQNPPTVITPGEPDPEGDELDALDFWLCAFDCMVDAAACIRETLTSPGGAGLSPDLAATLAKDYADRLQPMLERRLRARVRAGQPENG